VVPHRSSRPALAIVAGLVAGSLLATIGNPIASASDTATRVASHPPQCGPGAVHIVASTDHPAYPPGRTITMTSSITNVSNATCTIYLGYDPGFSPSFTVTKTNGTVVWDRCWLNDEPAACFTALRAHALRPGRRYEQKATWDQRSGPDGGPVVQVPQGQYTFTTSYQYIGSASTTFLIFVG